MSIPIKSAAQIEGMRLAGRLASEVLDMLTPHVRAGVTTLEIDRLAHEHMVRVQCGIPATLGYAPPGYPAYPASLCTSLNDVVCHGIPDERPLKNGDIVNIDVTVIKDGWHGDNSRMYIVGEAGIAARRLCQITFEAMWKGIVKVRPGARLGDIGHAIQTFAENAGFSVVREFCGHGVGARFHEEPQVLHYGRPGTLEELVPGMIFTIEPMINAGKRDIKEDRKGNRPYDGWTIVTRDRSLSAQWEHTVLVTDTGYEVLTVSAGSPPPPAFAAGGYGRTTPAPALAASDPMAALGEAGSGGPGGVAALRTRFRDGKAALIEQFRDARPTATAAARLVKALARHVDATLAELWRQSAIGDSAALVAVGGYGRGELFPYSDVDVLVLLSRDPDEALHDSVGRFVTACWDIGVEPGSSVRTVDECVAEADRDVTVQTALLEARLVCGARPLFRRLQDACAAAMNTHAFVRAKTLEMKQRHVKYEGTPYALEPNCKESPGGLRDLQVVIWVARAAGLGRTWRELSATGLITPFEASQLVKHEGTLRLVRARLHMVAGRREDRLVFDLQTAVARSMGLHETKEQLASEVLMHRYYWAAKAVTQLNQILMLNIEERINASEAAPMRPINERFLDRGGMLEVARDSLYFEHPHAILETFLVYQQTPGLQGLSARTLRALYNARELMDAGFRNDPENRRMFMEILRQPSGQTHALRQMNQTSVLGRYLWVFRRIVGRMQHDLFHVYTVDQHILMVVRNVRRFFIPEHAHEYPFCSQLAAQWNKPWVLYVAAIFHDVAKGRGGDHSELGAREARRFCRAHGIALDDARLIEFLVRHHLTMSRIAQKEDLSDTEVIAEFARRVGTPERLATLYLLTVADVRGTGPRVWNAWKGKLLEDLYRLTLRALGGARPHIDAEIDARKQEARQNLALHSALPGTEEPLWQTLELSYFARHDAADIAWHARSLWRHIETRVPIVRARASSVGDGLQVLVYSPDRPDLFARICGYFDGAGFSIQDAKIHTTRAGFALDTFQIVSTQFGADSPPDEREFQYRDLISLVETQAAQALASDGPLPEPRRGRVSRRVRSFPVPPRVSLTPDERAQHWLLSVSASDRTGLLYGIARVLARNHINLQLAKVSTLGERVEDTFLVDGPALQQMKTQVRIETEILDAVAAPVS